MVAMSSYWPFGTQIEINGVMYTVEDRGDTGIENDITRVDIYVLTHQEALRRGRFWADAKVYE
jgi:3D (Asp-Asp-Asp) domain-containing protein